MHRITITLGDEEVERIHVEQKRLLDGGEGASRSAAIRSLLGGRDSWRERPKTAHEVPGPQESLTYAEESARREELPELTREEMDLKGRHPDQFAELMKKRAG